MKTTRWTGLLGVLVLAACAADASDATDTPPFEPVGDMQQLMVTIVEPAADFYGDAVGTIIDMEGTVEIFPSSDEEWEAVRNAAYAIAESGNLMMVAGRGADEDT
jgi:hypothetical protein